METKPGIYTTEFWIHNILQILLALNTVGIWNYLPGQWGKIASILAQAVLGSAYMASRGKAKSKGSFDPHLKANFKLFPRKVDMTHR